MLSKDSMQMAKDDKFSSRMLSKESSVANPSFRVYYGVAAGAVPFLWESQPGMPKHAAFDAPLPPLTPPPAYFSSPPRGRGSKKPSKSSVIMDAILPRLILRKSISARSSSSSSSSTATSLISSPAASLTFRRPVSPLLSYSSRGEDDEPDDVGSPTSTLCFGGWRRGVSDTGRLRGHSVVPVKNAHRAWTSWV